MRLNDQQIENAIAIILRTGVLIAALLVAAGGAWYLAGHHGARPSYRVFRGAPAPLESIPAIAGGISNGDPLFIIQFGLLLLMATPVARVLACAFGFGLERDWKYTLISAIVLSAIMASLVG